MSQQQDRHFRPGIMLFPIRKYMSRPQHDFINTNVKRGMTALDLGSGPGFFTTMLSEAVGINGTVHAVDGDKAAVTRLQNRAGALGMVNIKAYASSAASIPYIQSKSIDVLFSNGLLCCMLDHRGAVDEMMRVMKTGSRGFISVTKLFRKDGLGVPKDEWKEITRSFDVVDSGSSVVMDWVVVSKPGDDKNEL
ncbi:SAM-dependent methyltransferase [Candidatus Mancarchaeum acidiphilum]|jgi:ubiquinone/menaquinone biosynthesis C-methylase UbiE|uniref:SAM-dependent methyltransferase n=2 Tax=Candidatus Mancarchaeum acidiphilum TaxID=1920749 RepID=A0A218NNZ7_9ARCH|nr:SAM-dependent methyltransferase [Candidatus Mancarchaeum acidiphilum]